MDNIFYFEVSMAPVDEIDFKYSLLGIAGQIEAIDDLGGNTIIHEDDILNLQDVTFVGNTYKEFLIDNYGYFIEVGILKQDVSGSGKWNIDIDIDAWRSYFSSKLGYDTSELILAKFPAWKQLNNTNDVTRLLRSRSPLEQINIYKYMNRKIGNFVMDPNYELNLNDFPLYVPYEDMAQVVMTYIDTVYVNVIRKRVNLTQDHMMTMDSVYDMSLLLNEQLSRFKNLITNHPKRKVELREIVDATTL